VTAEPQCAVRTEHDLLGDRDVPADVYYGVHTARALENFPISGVPISRRSDLVVALASVKQAAAEANQQLGQLDTAIAEAIVAACIEVRGGALHDQFVVDEIQGGAGTSTNMNANEVIANRALEILGHQRGDYHVIHPLEHVNCGQSTNDVYPTAVKVAVGIAAGSLEQALRGLAEHCRTKSGEFADLMKLGRTQLQDAVPMTLGQEFGAFVQLSGVTKRTAVKLSKICNDLRLLSSGPRAGFNEINLPPVQAGSSIMPGKVNPVIPEVVNQVAFEVIGNDLTITMAAEAGQLQLNAFEPIIARALLSSLNHLTAAVTVLGERCMRGITANAERMHNAVLESASIATVLSPLLGYEAATALVTEAIATGTSIPDLVRKTGLIDDAVLTRILSPENLCRPNGPKVND
jgi:aspartate ammonia-lyase